MNPPSRKLELTQDELDKVARARAKNESTKVDENWLFVAEFGYYFGWGGVQAILEDEISMEVANVLLTGARKVWSGQVYDHANASFIGSVSASSKKPSAQFKKLTKPIINQARADL